MLGRRNNAMMSPLIECNEDWGSSFNIS